MPDLEKKLRLQLFDSDFNQVADRLVGQNLELTTGPKEVHKGPMKVEVCLYVEEDIEKFVLYLNKLKGKLPLEEKIKKVKHLEMDVPEDREKLIDALIKESPTQDELIQKLRDRGFKFLTIDYIDDLELNFVVKDGDEKYQWMMKPIKEAKNPINSKYDPSIAFGFKLLDEKVSTFKVYLYGGKEDKKFIKPWKKDSKFTFKSTEMIKFPAYMIAEERIKWRAEHLQLKNDPKKVPSKFYQRWEKDVLTGNK